MFRLDLMNGFYQSSKFRCSKKAAKILNNLPLLRYFSSSAKEKLKIVSNFGGLLRISELFIIGTCVLLLVCCTEWINKADFFWSARIDVCFDDVIFLSGPSVTRGLRGAIVLIFLPNYGQNLIQLKIFLVLLLAPLRFSDLPPSLSKL